MLVTASMCEWRLSTAKGAADPDLTSQASESGRELVVGFVRRAHGLHGEVLVEFTTDRDERHQVGATYSTRVGPLTIESSRPRPPQAWLVRFAGVVSREAAEALRGVELRAAALDDPEELWVHDAVGAEVVDRVLGPVGTVVAVEANPAADLLVLDSGALIPMSFVLTHTRNRIEVELPDGLLEI